MGPFGGDRPANCRAPPVNGLSSSTAIRNAAVALAAAIAVSCSGSGPVLPSFELPTFDTAAVQELVDEAIAEVGRVTASPPAIELPPSLAALLEENDIRLPPLPSNVTEICQALGTPGVGAAASAGLSGLIESLIAGAESGLVIGMLVTVVVRTCPAWTPYLETAIKELL